MMSKRLAAISVTVITFVTSSITLYPIISPPDGSTNLDSVIPNPVDPGPINPDPIDLEEILQFSTLKRGYHCSIYETRNLTISDNETWYELWQEMHSYSTDPIPPYVNFTSEWVVAVFLGRRSNSGYEANITLIGRTATAYRIFFTEITAHDGGFMEPIEPYHIVKISGIPLGIPVEFVKSYVEGGDIYK